MGSPGRAKKAQDMLSPVAKKVKAAMTLKNQNGQYAIGLVAKPGKRKSVIPPGTVKKQPTKKFIDGPDTNRDANKTPLKSQVSYSTIKASAKNKQKAPGTTTSKKMKRRPSQISAVPSEFARSVVSASRENKQLKKSNNGKLIQKNSELFKFPSVAQMNTVTPQPNAIKVADFAQDDDEIRDSRAVIMENQYLKNQVAQLTKLVEEEKQNANKERELRENISQYSHMDNSNLNKTEYSPYDR